MSITVRIHDPMQPFTLHHGSMHTACGHCIECCNLTGQQIASMLELVCLAEQPSYHKLEVVNLVACFWEIVQCKQL